jgi:hypothetical protein
MEVRHEPPPTLKLGPAVSKRSKQLADVTTLATVYGLTITSAVVMAFAVWLARMGQLDAVGVFVVVSTLFFSIGLYLLHLEDRL